MGSNAGSAIYLLCDPKRFTSLSGALLTRSRSGESNGNLEASFGGSERTKVKVLV